MKKYICFALLAYITFFVCVVLWRIPAIESRKTVQKWVIDGLQTEKRHVFVHPISINSTKTTNSILKRSLLWQWNNTNDNDFRAYTLHGETSCEGNFIGYDHKFAKLTNVVIDPNKGKGRRGGENCSDVFNQPEENEYHVLTRGYFKLFCLHKAHYTFNLKSHVSHWQEVLTVMDQIPEASVINQGWTIAIIRYEYANLYHTMTDYYNTFFVAKLFKMQPGNITILWLDGHPAGTLDETWGTLFGKVARAGDIKKTEMFSHMVWGIMGYDSPLNNHNNKNVPYLEEFRSFFLSRYGTQTKSELKCSRLNIMFLWRRDYLAHPRNPSGSVSRKAKNEDELLESAKKKFQTHFVSGIQIDKLSMNEQLETIAGTDILIGMHGAGLSHTLFLPKHAGLIELYPTYWSSANQHFLSIAMWRKLHYLSWINTDSKNELPDHFTIVDVKAVTDMIGEMENRICR